METDWIKELQEWYAGLPCQDGRAEIPEMDEERVRECQEWYSTLEMGRNS